MDNPKYAFSCKNCGALESGRIAGDNALPVSCHICGKGIDNPDNWIVLSKLTAAQLKELPQRLTKADVETHPGVGLHKPGGKSVKLEAVEKIGSKDRG